MKKPFYFQIAVKAFEKKALEGGKQVVRIKGFASTPQIDRHNDRIEPQAFAEAVKEYLQLGTLLRSHNQDYPAGKIDSATVSDGGLEVEGDVLDEKCQEEVMDGRLGAFSIGYIAKESVLEHADGTPFNAEVDNWWDPTLVRVIKKLDLVEISLVTCPANPGALFTVAKSVKAFFQKQMAFVKKSVEAKGLTAPADIALEFKSYGMEGDVEFEGKDAIDAEAEKATEEVEKKAEMGDACTMEDGSEGTMQDDGNGNMVCKAKKAEEKAAEGTQETKAEGAEAEAPKPEAQKEPEKPAETAGADGGEGGEKPAEKPNAEGADGKTVEVAAPAPAAEAKTVVLTIKDLKPFEVLASIMGVDAVKAIIPDLPADVRTVEVPEEVKAAMSGIIEMMEKAVSAEIKRADDLQAIVDKMPTKRALAPFGPYGGAEEKSEAKPGKKPNEVSEGFKSLFKNAIA